MNLEMDLVEMSRQIRAHQTRLMTRAKEEEVSMNPKLEEMSRPIRARQTAAARKVMAMLAQTIKRELRAGSCIRTSSFT